MDFEFDDLSIFDLMEPIPNRWTADVEQPLTSSTPHSECPIAKAIPKEKALENLTDMEMQMYLDFDYENPPKGTDLPKDALEGNWIIPGLFEFGSHHARGHGFIPNIDLSEAPAWPEPPDHEDEQFLPPWSEVSNPSLNSLVETFSPLKSYKSITTDIASDDEDGSSSDEEGVSSSDDEDDNMQGNADTGNPNTNHDDTLRAPATIAKENKEENLRCHRPQRARPSYCTQKPNVGRDVLSDVIPFRHQAPRETQQKKLRGRKKSRDPVKITSKSTRKPRTAACSVRKARRSRAPAVCFTRKEVASIMDRWRTLHQPHQLCIKTPRAMRSTQDTSGWRCQEPNCDDVAPTPALALTHALIHSKVDLICRGCFTDCGEKVANFKAHVTRARRKDKVTNLCIVEHPLISKSSRMKGKKQAFKTTIEDEIGAIGNAVFVEKNSLYTEGGRLVVVKWT